MHLLRSAVLLAVACLTSAKPTYLAPTPVFPPPYITVVKETRSYPNDGAFSSYFEASNGIAVALQGSKRLEGGGAVIRGNYSYLQDDGSQAEVIFVADENGYQPSSDLLPVGHPMPAHSLLQIEKARLAGSSKSSEEISRPRSYTSKPDSTTTTAKPPRYAPPPTTTTQRPQSYTRRAYTQQIPRLYTTTTEKPSSPAEDSSEEVELAYSSTTAEPSTKRIRTYTRAPTTTTTTTTPAPIPRIYGVPDEDSTEEEITTPAPLAYTPPEKQGSDGESEEEITPTTTKLPLRYISPEEALSEETASEEDSAEEEIVTTTALPLRYTAPVETASEEDSAEEIVTTTALPLRYTAPVETASKEDSAEEKIATATELSLPLVYNSPQESVSVEEVSEVVQVATSLPILTLDEEASSEEITTSTTTSTTTRRPYRYLRFSRVGYKEVRSEEDLTPTTTTTTTEPSTTTRRGYTKPYYLRRFTTPRPFIYKAPSLYFPQFVKSSSLLTTDDSEETVKDESDETLADDKSEETLAEVTQASQGVIDAVVEESEDAPSVIDPGANTIQNTFTVVGENEETEVDILDSSSEQALTVDTVTSETGTLPVNPFSVILDDDQVDSIETSNVSLEETVSSEDLSLNSNLKVLADDLQETLDKIDTVGEINNSTESVDDVTAISFKTLEDVFQAIGGVVQSLASRELSDKILITELPAVVPLPTDSVNVPEHRFTIVQSSEDLSLDRTSHESLSSLETVTESAEEINSNENKSELINDTSNETLEKLSFNDGTILDISSEEIGLLLTTNAATVAVDETETAPSKTITDVFAEINNVVDSLKSQESLEVLATPAASEISVPQFTVVQSNEILPLDFQSGKLLLSSEELSLGLTQALITSELAAIVNKTSEVVAAPAVVDSVAAPNTVSDEIEGEVTTEAASDENLAVFVSVSNEFENVEVTGNAALDEHLGELLVVSSEASSDELLSEQVHVPSLQTTIDDDTTETTDGPPSVEQLFPSYSYPPPSV